MSPELELLVAVAVKAAPPVTSEQLDVLRQLLAPIQPAEPVRRTRKAA